ncbi:hypothetical protein M9H77_21811 [Catharanthus roseus]|uniref:Uncharacterized protein n=1 Tax=Catharanthus roseus TaxID=4058 RepID=A0ACC0ANE1_CATRO|nr:hypothetical protein M9H77_21811 [Catharanthus roseus]
MYKVSQNVDLSLKVDALSKKFDQLLALNTLPTNSPNVQDNKVGEPIKDNELNENETEEIDIETKLEKNVKKELGNQTTYHYHGDYRDCLLLLQTCINIPFSTRMENKDSIFNLV